MENAALPSPKKRTVVRLGQNTKLKPEGKGLDQSRTHSVESQYIILVLAKKST